MPPAIHNRPAATLLLCAVLGMAGFGRIATAQQAPGLDPKIELLELQTTLQVAHAKIQELEKQIAAAREQNAALTQSAAAANAGAGQLKENYERLRGLLEGLGIGALENSTDQVQERLLTALSDLRIVNEQKKRITECLVDLAEASLMFARSAQGGDTEARKKLESLIGASEQTLRSMGISGDDAAPAKGLHDAKVVSLKAEIGVAVLDVGSRDGVKPGMPFEIFREDKPVAKVLVTEVRRGVCGVVVQELMNNADPIKVGDRGKVNPNRTF